MDGTAYSIISSATVKNGEYLFLVPKKLFLAPNCWSAPKCLFDPNIWIWHLIASTQPKVARSSSWTPYLLFADSAPKPKHPAPILFHVCLPNSRNLPDFMYPNKHERCIRWCQVPFSPVEIMINAISSQKRITSQLWCSIARRSYTSPLCRD